MAPIRLADIKPGIAAYNALALPVHIEACAMIIMYTLIVVEIYQKLKKKLILIGSVKTNITALMKVLYMLWENDWYAAC